MTTIGGLGPRTPAARRELAGLEGRRLNFDRPRLGALIAAGGWNVDDMRQPLPPEPPGEPLPDGSFEHARRVMIDYQAADPRLVRATYDSERPLAGRDMLLELRFLFLKIRAGVRVGDVYEEHRHEGERRAHVHGWNYCTLDGHFEQGQMAYEVWKWEDTGEVEFHIHAASRMAQSGPLWTRLGFWLLGRRIQLRFYRNTCRRMATLVQARLRAAR